MSELNKYGITRLNSENYSIWKIKMEILLKEDSLWDVISKDIPAERTSAWSQSNEKARGRIILMLEDEKRVKPCEPSKGNLHYSLP